MKVTIILHNKKIINAIAIIEETIKFIERANGN